MCVEAQHARLGARAPAPRQTIRMRAAARGRRLLGGGANPRGAQGSDRGEADALRAATLDRAGEAR